MDMRSAQEVAEKLKILCDRRLAERMDKFLSVCHLNCAHNVRYRVRGQGQVGFCMNDELRLSSRRKVIICDDKQTAHKCKFYKLAKTAEDVESDFREILRDPARCGQEYPKIAVLLWVLQGRMDEGDKQLKSLLGSLLEMLKRRGE